MSAAPAEDDPLLEQHELLGHLLGDAQVMLWLFRVRDALEDLVELHGFACQGIRHLDRVQPGFAVRSWYWELRTPEAPSLTLALSLAVGNEGLVECNLALVHPDALDSPWATLEAHQRCVVPLVHACQQRDWQSPGYAAVRMRVALDKASVHTVRRAESGELPLLARPVKPWLAPALQLLLGYLQP